jgi:hypothetical protein
LLVIWTRVAGIDENDMRCITRGLYHYRVASFINYRGQS